MAEIIVKAPATSANLACGFDSFGAAFSLYSEFIFKEGEGKTVIKDSSREYSNENNLAYRAFVRAEEEMGVKVPLSLIEAKKCDIPYARGLGSSSALIVSGIKAASVLSKKNLSDEETVEIGTLIEGHPDNIAPCVYGGFTASAISGGKVLTSKYKFHPSLKFALIIPEFRLSTEKARGVLPKLVPFADAIYNLSRTAILSDGFCTGDTEKIAFAMSDRLHQPYRKSLIPGYDEVEKMCLDAGGISFAISGAGPTMISVYTDNAVFAKISAELEKSGLPMKAHSLLPDENGVRAEFI